MRPTRRLFRALPLGSPPPQAPRTGVLSHADFLLRNGYLMPTPDARGHGTSGGALITYGIRESLAAAISTLSMSPAPNTLPASSTGSARPPPASRDGPALPFRRRPYHRPRRPSHSHRPEAFRFAPGFAIDTILRMGLSRRTLLVAGLAAGRLAAQSGKGAAFPAASRRYSDPTTELDVFRLTDPACSSTLPAYYNRVFTRNSGVLLFASDRGGSPQAFRMDLKTAETRQLTDAAQVDAASLTLTPDNHSFCYCAGPALWIANFTSLRDRRLYETPEGWERSSGMSIGPDGTHAALAESKGDGSRLRLVPLVNGVAATVVEAPYVMTDPIARPMRAQILYRQADQALWLVNSDGQQNRRLKLAPGRVGPANWSADGRTLLYLNFPDDPSQLNAIREHTPDTNADRLVAKTSQFVHFGFNRDSSVFVGASRNTASPTILLLLRITRRELTLCEHKTSHPADAAPRFSPDSQRIYFQSDRDGKPAIYDVHVERLVERTEGEE